MMTPTKKRKSKTSQTFLIETKRLSASLESSSGWRVVAKHVPGMIVACAGLTGFTSLHHYTVP